jgi:hypothetical protein
MAKKFEILKDDFLRVTDTVSNKIELLEPKSNVFYNAVSLNKGEIKMYFVQGVNKSNSIFFKTTIGEAIDGSDVVFTAQTFEDFCTDSKLGFKSASGGSGAGGDSYMQMYANKKYVLPSSGRFAGVGGTVGYTNSDVDLDSGDTTAIGYIADAAAVVIGTSDFAYKLEQIRASSNAMTFADEIQLAVGYRDIRDGQFYNNNSPNPVLLHTENIVKSGSTGYNCWTKLITFATPLDIPANKEVVIGYKCTIFDGAAASVNMWHCATTLTLKKV